jgi:ABC-type amino acid transport substrate-binding protein
MHDDNSRNPGNIRALLDDARHLISQYPRLALPVGVVLGLFLLATVCKTLIDGLGWAFSFGENAYIGQFLIGKYLGGALVISIFALASTLVLRIVKAAIAPRPTIHPLPAHCLSRSPIVKWEYKLADRDRHVNYELHVRSLKSYWAKTFTVPERMHQIAIPDTIGPLEIWVNALMAGRRISRSNVVRTEIYRDSVQRICETRVLRIAVHTDPAEEVFCFYRDGRWQGLDTDFATLIASELQADLNIDRPLEIEYFFYEWPAVIGAPSGHEVDMAIASI